uniref:SGNH_hydro domain-containing protein n=1 Tax=Angiostrongylus cantonensis TaxID=6313 RepID=A0A0K0DGF2_ANGCA
MHILRIFNPGIIGMSHGIGYDNTVFNVAVSGRTSMDIPRQAEELIHRMKAKGVRLRDDWKLISIFIGTNDLGELRCHLKEKPISRDVYKTKLEEGIGLLRSNLSRTIVSIVSMWNPQLTIDAKSLIDEGWAMFFVLFYVFYVEDPFSFYERRFDHKDFTVVVQGFMDDIRDAFRNKSGEYDKSFYASDVFHLSKYGNAVLGKFLWNNLIEAVGRKTTQADLGNDEFPIKCPSKVSL